MLNVYAANGPLSRPSLAERPEFERLLGANSVPGAGSPFPPGEIRAVLDRVHEQVLRALPALDEAERDQPVPQPHPFAKTKFLALLLVRQPRDAARRSDRLAASSA